MTFEKRTYPYVWTQKGNGEFSLFTGRRKAQGSLSILSFSVISAPSSHLVPMHTAFLREEEDDKNSKILWKFLNL